MTGAADWQPVVAELARWQAAGHVARLWLRDDDAVAVTPALQRLAALSRAHAVPITLAVIPAGADVLLADFVARQANWRVAVHGFQHRNHAPPGEKKCELGSHRPRQVVLADIARGLDWLDGLFATRLMAMLVPPWNRIDAALVADLPRLGIETLSAFGPEPAGLAAGPRRLNTHIDIIDWRGHRGGLDHATLIAALATALTEARQAGGRPVGVLTHHRVHDDVAWAFIAALTAFVGGRGDIGWWSPGGSTPSAL